MSIDCADAEAYDVYTETRRRARKEHKCCACKEAIRPGDYYEHIGAIAQGDAATFKRCLRCQRIHEHLRTKAPCDTWPDEQLNCGHGYREMWGEDPPLEIQALAFATRDEVQERQEARA